MGFCAAAVAQDVPGIEICTAEKTMERRTSCLQSNVNFLQQSLTKQALSFQQKLDANTREMDGLKTLIAAMRKEIDELKAAKEKEPAKK
jgi:peptidoglycan hydrolase CwlO-like protein